MPILNRDLILNQTTLRRELVPVPEWGGEVYIRELTAIERDNYELELSKQAAAAKGRPTYPLPAFFPPPPGRVASCGGSGEGEAGISKSEILRKLKAPNHKSGGSLCVWDGLFVFSVVLCALRGSVVEGKRGGLIFDS